MEGMLYLGNLEYHDRYLTHKVKLRVVFILSFWYLILQTHYSLLEVFYHKNIHLQKVLTTLNDDLDLQYDPYFHLLLILVVFLDIILIMIKIHSLLLIQILSVRSLDSTGLYLLMDYFRELCKLSY